MTRMAIVNAKRGLLSGYTKVRATETVSGLREPWDKASGGVRDHETALNLIGAGASRLGASASVAIVECAAPAGQGY